MKINELKLKVNGRITLMEDITEYYFLSNRYCWIQWPKLIADHLLPYLHHPQM
jgi:hypothetical protein